MADCRGCGLVFARSPGDDLARHGQRYHATREAAERGRVEVARASYTLDALLHWARRFSWSERSRLLEVGCGEGRLLEIARAMGFEANGIDISDYYAERWRARGLVAEVEGVESYAARQAGRYDAVIARQVIEHVTQPVPFLTAIGELLTDDGVAIVETGDVESLQVRLQGHRWSYWVPLEGVGAHVTFLSRRSASKLAQRALMRLANSEPLGRYRSFSAYVHEDPRRRYGLRSLARFVAVASPWSAGRCYYFVRAKETGTGDPIGPAK